MKIIIIMNKQYEQILKDMGVLHPHVMKKFIIKLLKHLRRYIVKEEMKLMQRKNRQHLKDMEMRIIEMLIK